jgi:hypothetical protein
MAYSNYGQRPAKTESFIGKLVGKLLVVFIIAWALLPFIFTGTVIYVVVALMHIHVLTVNSIVFLGLSLIWSKSDWFNLILKFGFLALGLINLAIVFGVKL